MHIKRIASVITGSLAFALAVPALATAATNTVTVTGDNQAGWLFNRDASTSSPYEMTDAEASTGQGSLYVLPITNTTESGTPENKDKFIAEQFVNTPVNNFNSVSYDYLIAGNGTEADDAEFYMNVYANLPGSTTYYDCRYDYVPTTGSTTEFTTAMFGSTDTPQRVFDRANDGYTCPATLAEMQEGSNVSFFSLSVGGTSDSDTGLAGYYDNVVVNLVDGTTVYDFEPVISVASKEDCKNGGWEKSNTPVYKNQGDCVSSFASKGKAKGSPSVVENVRAKLSSLFQ